MTSARVALSAVLVLGVAACRSGDAPGERRGAAEATAADERTVTLGARTLVLDGFAGDVRVETDTAAVGARVRVTRRARGATDASARARLALVTVETGGDDEIYQIVWRANTAPSEAGLRADVVATVPPGTRVVVRTLAGGVAVDGPLGSVDVGVGAGAVIVGRAAARTLRVAVEAGDVSVSAAQIPAGAAWTVETGAGSVDLSVRPDASVRVDASSDAGQANVRGLSGARVEHLYSRPAGGHLSATLGRGAASVRLHTAAGAVRVGAATDIGGTESGRAE